jgi:endonuclease/exonuclease/phosphatase family metal-dependent hydrolase
MFIELVRQYQPHIICLQEITVSLRQLLLKQPEIQRYYVCYKHFRLKPNEYRSRPEHGLMTLTRIPPEAVQHVILPSNTKRAAIIVWLKLNNETGTNSLAIANFHLESHMKATHLRKLQIKSLQNKTKSAHCAILMGDSNMITDEENRSLNGKYKDMFMYLKDKEVIPRTELGLTFDLTSNHMGHKICGWTQKSRLDRIFISHETIDPLSLSVIGEKPFYKVGKKLWVSYNFGIIGKILLIKSSK